MRATGFVLLDRASVSSVDIASLVDRSPFESDCSFTDVTISRLASGLQVMDFNGSTSKAEGPAMTDVMGRTAYLTLAAWANYDTVVNTAGIISTSGTIGFILGFDGTTKMRFRVQTDSVGAQADTTDLTGINGVWGHVVGVMDLTLASAELKLYINGALIDSTDAAGTYLSQTGVNDLLEIGNDRLGTRFWDGKIALPRVYKKALSAGQVLQLYNAQKAWFK